jgi:hypothetical protein
MFEVLMPTIALCMVLVGIASLLRWAYNLECDRNEFRRLARKGERLAAENRESAVAWKERYEHYENAYEQCRKDLLYYKAQVENIREVLNQ